MFKKMLIFAALIAPLLIVLAVAQQPPVKRMPLQPVDFLPGFTKVTVATEVAADDCVAGNTNPGIETTYVLEGAILVEVRGRSPETLRAAVFFQTPPLTVGVACCKREARDSPEFPWDAPASAGRV
jgi:hypothetical protein